MIKHFLAGSSISIFLVTGALAAQAETPRPEPQSLGQATTFPPSAQNTSLSKYAATDAVPVIKLGDQGQAVADVQQYLKQAGLYIGEVDGVYGKESQAAIVQFQALADLRIDGIVGAETWKAMINDAS